MFGCGLGSGFTGGWSSWMIIPMIFRFLIIGGIIYFAVKLIKGHTISSNGAMKMLDEKYAMGEIDEEEYTKRKGVLKR